MRVAAGKPTEPTPVKLLLMDAGPSQSLVRTLPMLSLSLIHIYAIFLDAAHLGSGHPAREDGVFREIIEVAAAKGAALDVQARAEQDSHFLCSGFLAQRCV